MKNIEDLVDEALDRLDVHESLKAEQIPDIGMYMDQVTTFMEENMSREKRYPDDKVLTKTMINNYTKNHLLPPSDKKKYSRDHILLLILIYYYKSLLSFRDIEELFEPLTKDHFRKDTSLPLSEIYDRLFMLSKEQTEPIKEDIRKKAKDAKAVFNDENAEDSDFLCVLALINDLFSEIYIKKRVIEYLIDRLAEENGRSL